MLKGNLINKLSELILIGEHSDINKNNYIKVQFECEKQLTIAKKLLFVNVYHNAEKLVKKVLKRAASFHIVDVEAECYQLLRKINYLKGFPDKTEHFNLLSEQKLLVSSKVDEARGTIELFLSEIKFLRTQSKDIAERCSQYILPLVAYDKKSPFIELAILRLRMIKAHQDNDMEEWGTTISELQGFLKQYPHLLTEHLKLELNVSYIKYHLALSSYSKANKAIKSLLQFTTFEAFNRHEVLAEQYLFYCQRDKLEKAVEVFTEATQSLQFKMLDTMDQAAWSLRGAYLHFMINLTAPKLKFKDYKGKKLTSFFNECKPVSKDKTGYHLQFVIIRVLLLHLKDSIDYDSEQNSLKVYQSRHLKKRLPVRSTIFYAYLIKLTKGHFKKGSYQTLTKSFLKEMESHPPHIEHSEVFRYEHLWAAIGNGLR